MKEYPNEGNIKDKENQLYLQFITKVDEFVKETLKGYKPSNYNNTKVIHDSVWGTNLFYPWELQIIDSPLIQRLRKIRQVGLAYLTYPSAQHTRFEHTLGVMSVITKMVNNINQEHIGSDNQKIISNSEFYMLRLAALMHDVGHCFFSHLSEVIYGNLKSFVDLKKSFNIFSGAKEHEIFAYLIVNCNSFKQFMKLVSYPEQTDDFFYDCVGRIIIGAFINPINNKTSIPIKKYYLTQMINGQYDADKLDYLRRDSYTAGLALTYDIERFLSKIQIAELNESDENGNIIIGKHLTIPLSGISAVEEMAFSQLMLASYIYQHQKVLATDSLIYDVAEGLIKNGKLDHPCDFLYYTDEDIFNIFTNISDEEFKQKISCKIIDSASSKTLSDIVKRVIIRDLPKRALAINFNTVDETVRTKYKIADLADTLRKLTNLRQEICEEAQKISNSLSEKDGGNKVIDVYDIHISIPKTSIAKNLNNAIVVTNDNRIVALSEIVRLSDWADAFSYHKWNAYIFARADIVPIVAIASKKVFQKYGINFSDKVFKNCKEEKDIESIQIKLESKGNR